MSYIDSVASNSVRVSHDKFNHWVFQDFPIKARWEIENEIQKKSNKVGHQRGGECVNFPQKQMHIVDAENDLVGIDILLVIVP